MPFLDRIDINIEVPSVDYDKLTADRLAEPSEAIRARRLVEYRGMAEAKVRGRIAAQVNPECKRAFARWVTF